MTRTWARTVNLFTAAVLTCGAPILSQAQSHFSGTWILQGSDKKTPRSTMTVKQSDEAVEVTTESENKSTVNTFPLNGSRGTYRTETGVVGMGIATWKGNDLLIETFVISPPVNGKSIRFHEKQRWRLSKDGTILKIHIDTDSPDMPAEVMSVAIQPITETYKRATP